MWVVWLWWYLSFLSLGSDCNFLLWGTMLVTVTRALYYEVTVYCSRLTTTTTKAPFTKRFGPLLQVSVKIPWKGTPFLFLLHYFCSISRWYALYVPGLLFQGIPKDICDGSPKHEVNHFNHYIWGSVHKKCKQNGWWHLWTLVTCSYFLEVYHLSLFSLRSHWWIPNFFTHLIGFTDTYLSE